MEIKLVELEEKINMINQSDEANPKILFSRTKLKRFLKGNDTDVDKTISALILHSEWRVKYNVDCIDLSKIQHEMSSGKAVIHGRSKDGKPVVTVYSEKHNKSSRSAEEMRLYIIYTLEQAISIARPEEEQIVLLFDLSNFSVNCMDYEVVKLLISILKYNYPETLSEALIFNPPWIFNAFWIIVRPWLDPVTASKIRFVHDKITLQQYIEEDQLHSEISSKIFGRADT